MPNHVGELESILHRTLRGQVDALRLTPANEGLVLHGRARSFCAKQLAQEAVMHATAVPIIANRIKII
jgi:hypothetical protein